MVSKLVILTVLFALALMQECIHASPPGSPQDCQRLEEECSEFIGMGNQFIPSPQDQVLPNYIPEPMKQTDYIRTCRMEEVILPCVHKWADRCLKPGQADYFLDTTSQMLQRCYDVDSYLRYLQMFQCAIKLNNDTETVQHQQQCQAKLTSTEKLYAAPMINWGWTVVSQAIKSQSYQQDICCMVSKSLKCDLTGAEKVCGVDELRSFHIEAEQTLGMYGCIDQILDKCHEA